MAATLVTANGEKCIADRLGPTLEAAERELVSARRTGMCFRFPVLCRVGILTDALGVVLQRGCTDGR